MGWREWGHGGGVSYHSSLVGEGGGDLVVAGDIGSSSMSFPPIYHPSSAVVGLINWEDERLPDPKLRNQIQVKQSCPED